MTILGQWGRAHSGSCPPLISPWLWLTLSRSLPRLFTPLPLTSPVGGLSFYPWCFARYFPKEIWRIKRPPSCYMLCKDFSIGSQEAPCVLGKSARRESQDTCVPLGLPLTLCVTWSKSCGLSDPQFPHLYNRDNNPCVPLDRKSVV